MIKEVSAEEIKTLIDDGESFIVDYYAEWCGPCIMIAETLKKIENDIDLDILKLNVDNNREFSIEMNIRNIPQLHFYNKGEKQSVKVGITPDNVIKEEVEKIKNS